ncbi:uncharacterized protein L969DRAFT_82610 [Mixia osmundae IAM 14324]|uniref:MADS-box domain-containing protein n=1 Tax=Mixia osmundae (strain CBS 9802 / IAM 14324 / JCM 22182 / KY 12970) TaxID=764103 RepID=G7DZ57_MIXOS|nr:uncharacterized protein L969DRAFT_82610 [Mixia osmundae IAM 14324]KEI38268.1 hypothetical protein L969DRAFT_82610 [Mixia osmundae IAM 14324]GAA95867.1 hypothetical protein E5Q_02524 [Mixia osmundae IAM 14324]
MLAEPDTSLGAIDELPGPAMASVLESAFGKASISGAQATNKEQIDGAAPSMKAQGKQRALDDSSDALLPPPSSAQDDASSSAPLLTESAGKSRPLTRSQGSVSSQPPVSLTMTPSGTTMEATGRTAPEGEFISGVFDDLDLELPDEFGPMMLRNQSLTRSQSKQVQTGLGDTLDGRPQPRPLQSYRSGDSSDNLGMSGGSQRLGLGFNEQMAEVGSVSPSDLNGGISLISVQGPSPHPGEGTSLSHKTSSNLLSAPMLKGESESSGSRRASAFLDAPSAVGTPATSVSTAQPSSADSSSNALPTLGSNTSLNEDAMVIVEDNLEGDEESDDEANVSTGKKGAGIANAKKYTTSGRRKIDIQYITEKSKRHITFSKRKAGIMKKAYELSTLTGTQVLLLVVSETGLVYTFTTNKLQPIVTDKAGKNLIQKCLSAKGEQSKDTLVEKPASAPPTVSNAAAADPAMSAHSPYASPHPQLAQGAATPMLSTPAPVGMPAFPQAYHPNSPFILPSASGSATAANNSAYAQAGTPGSLHIPSPLPGTPQPMLSPSSQSRTPRTLKKRKTTENLKLRETAAQLDARRRAAAILAEQFLIEAQQAPTIANLLRAFQQADESQRTRPPKLGPNGMPVVEGLDGTLHLFQSNCEDRPEAQVARQAGKRWMDLHGCEDLEKCFIDFFTDFLVTKCPSSEEEVSANSKDLLKFVAWLHGHHFITKELEQQIMQRCPTHVLDSSKPFANLPDSRTDKATKALSEYCVYLNDDFAPRRGGLTMVGAFRGFYSVERVRRNYALLGNQALDHENITPFKVRLPYKVTRLLKPQDQLYLGLNQVAGKSYWVPVESGQIQSVDEEALEPNWPNPEYHQMELASAQRNGDQAALTYHLHRYHQDVRSRDLLQGGDLSEDEYEDKSGSGGMATRSPRRRPMVNASQSVPNLKTLAAQQQQNAQASPFLAPNGLLGQWNGVTY